MIILKRCLGVLILWALFGSFLCVSSDGRFLERFKLFTFASLIVLTIVGSFCLACWLLDSD